MMKKTIIGALSVLLTLSFIGVVMGAGKGNGRKGKYTYRKVYKTCFERGAIDSQKPPLSPDTKTQAQWTRVFEKKDFDQFGCKEEWSTLSEKELNDVYTYLHDHAADSPSPAKCK
jgi:hypothetical protein